MSDEHITVELKFIDHSWKQANIRCSFCWAQTSWTWLASTHEVDLDAAIDRLSWSAESDIHVSAEDEKYQSQIKISKSDSDGSRVGWHASSLIYSYMNMVKKTELLCQHVACPEPSEQEQHDALPCFWLAEWKTHKKLTQSYAESIKFKSSISNLIRCYLIRNLLVRFHKQSNASLIN